MALDTNTYNTINDAINTIAWSLADVQATAATSFKSIKEKNERIINNTGNALKTLGQLRKALEEQYINK